MFYNKEQVDEAKNIDLVEFTKDNGFIVKEEGSAYRITDFDGGLYVFKKNQNNTSGFYWHKYNLKGNAIDFCKTILKDDYLKAIGRLLNYKNGSVQSLDSMKPVFDNNLSVQSLDTKKTFILPERDHQIKQSYSYLIHTRKISKNIVDLCIKNGIIRQFRKDKFTYVGFIGKDKNNKPKYLMLRSTLTGSSYKQEYENSNKEYGFKIFDKDNLQNNKVNIHIFESPIDLLSYMTIYPGKDIKDNVYLSMGGISDKALKRFIEDYKPNINEIKICFDNDEAGQTNANKIKDIYSEYNVLIQKPVYKDYNEDLINIIQNRETTNLNNENQLKP